MAEMRIRVYNVRFGDAYFLSIPDTDSEGVETTRHILIDVGNSLMKEGGKDEVFEPVVKDILKELNGNPLDLFIMTHEHLDHIQGLHHTERKVFPDSSLKDQLQTKFAWLTASAEVGYYDKFPQAKKALDLYEQIDAYVSAVDEKPSELIQNVLNINNPRSTRDNVTYLSELAENTFYVHRGTEITNEIHPFEETQFEIWAPEEDTSTYYGRFRPMALGLEQGDGDASSNFVSLVPPVGVDAGAFYNLVEARQGYVENLLAIDKARNNTSVVFYLEWRGWKFLFPGDAEIKSWKYMDKNVDLKQVHFMKVSHHGSHNGTPEPTILDKILPLDRGDDQRSRVAVVSTWENTHSGVPDPDTLKMFHDPDESAGDNRCDDLVCVDQEIKPGCFLDLVFKDAPAVYTKVVPEECKL